MPSHTLQAYDEELKFLATRIAQMGGHAERMVEEAVAALVNSNEALAQTVIRNDRVLDEAEREIDDKAVLIIARRQPMARDLREIMVAIRVASDLERIGDLAKNIAKRTHAISEQLPRKLAAGLTRMGRLSLEELKDVLDAYTTIDDAKALDVWRNDGELDALYNSIFRELLTYMMEDPRNITACTHLLFCAKNIERIGDHATNIAETVHYIVTGSQLPAERPKEDESHTVVVAGH
jgi:phosphate transport system protein